MFLVIYKNFAVSALIYLVKTNIFKQMSQSPNKMIEIVGSTSEK